MKATRKVTYRRNNYPCIILEGFWLTEKYGLEIGDTVNVKYGKNFIKIKRQQPRKEVNNLEVKNYKVQSRRLGLGFENMTAVQCVNLDVGKDHVIETHFVTNYPNQGRYRRVIREAKKEMKRIYNERAEKWGHKINWI